MMGVRASNLSLCECHQGSQKERSLSCWHKLSPPSYNHNWTDLHYAASHGNLRRIIDILNRQGAQDLNRRDYYGKAPLYWAAYKGHRGCMEELIRRGADVNSKCRHGGMPLHAVVSLYPDCARLLIKNDADVNQADNWGVTPMYLAASNAQLEVIRYLIIAGAKLTYRNKKTGEIPKQLAQHKDFCDYLGNVDRQPRSLQRLTRTVIRNNCGGRPSWTIPKLPLPEKLKSYLLLSDLTPTLPHDLSLDYK